MWVALWFLKLQNTMRTRSKKGPAKATKAASTAKHTKPTKSAKPVKSAAKTTKKTRATKAKTVDSKKGWETDERLQQLKDVLLSAASCTEVFEDSSEEEEVELLDQSTIAALLRQHVADFDSILDR